MQCLATTRSGQPQKFATEPAGDLRDALHLLRPGDLPGPSGETYLAWRRAVERPVSVKALHRAPPGLDPELFASWLDAGTGATVRRATIVLDLIGRLHERGLIGTGPRSPGRGAPYTFVTTEQFLAAFDQESLRDLPDREQMRDTGVVVDRPIRP